MDSFVSGILEDPAHSVPAAAAVSAPVTSAERETAGPLRFLHKSSEPPSALHTDKSSACNDRAPNENYLHAVDHSSLPNRGKSLQQSAQFTQSLFGYALIFINFTFVVASMLLIMSGIVARRNAAIVLCEACGYITLAALVFGIILWLFAIFGFIWIRQRQMLFLLVYGGFLVVLLLVLLILIIVAAVYDKSTQVSLMDPSHFMDAWMRGVNDTETNKSYSICYLQERFNCSGFHDGCCVPGKCYNESFPPQWVEKVCPICPGFPPMTPNVCTDAVYSTVRKNLSAFLVVSSVSMILIVAGVVFAILFRSAARLMTAVH